MVVLASSAPTEEQNVPTYELAAFWVDPDMRGQKVGSRIVEESIRWIREDASKNGWKQTRYQLNVKPENHRAINLYNRLGFSFVNKSNESDSSAEDGLVKMSMNINVS
jgi:ribosomal protein S18 acetylase RimI-like enzyme